MSDALARMLTEAGCPERVVPAGDFIFAEGSMGAEGFYIRSGQVHVVRRDPDGRDRRVAVLEAGELFGEAAFLDRTPRLAGTIAATECRLLEISTAALPRLLARMPGVAMELVRLFTRRLRVANARTLQAQLAAELSRRLIDDVEVGAARIARELGEGPRRLLAGCYRALEQCAERARTNQSRAATELERLEESLQMLIESLKMEVSVLAADRRGPGAVALLRRRLTRVQVDTGLRIRLDWPDELPLEPAVEKAVFDLVDASVSSARGLGLARTVEIDVGRAGSELEVRIRHDGSGYDIAEFAAGKFAEAASDLEALRDRALLVGGQLDARAGPSGGAVMCVRIPLGAR